MKAFSLNIDGKSITAPEGATIFEAAKSGGISIPGLCHLEQLKPYGGCRLCMVEISKNGRKRLVASCAYPVQEGLEVQTNTEQIRKIRKTLIELLGPAAQQYAAEYGAVASRFRTQNLDCSLCGICVRYCNEVKKANALHFKGRGIDREIALVPDAGMDCVYCQECVGYCTGGKLFSLIEAAYG